MGWKDGLRKGSYKGVEFEATEHTLKTGQRGQNNEYPQRNKNYFEGLGRKTRRFSFEAFVIGDDYFKKRDALLEAVESDGPGTLVHPYLGNYEAVCLDCDLRESITDGRMATFRLSFIEKGQRLNPSKSVDTQAKVRDASDILNQTTVTSFTDNYSVKGLPGFVSETAAQAVKEWSDVISQNALPFENITSQLSFLAGNASIVSRDPSLLANSIVDITSDAGVEGIPIAGFGDYTFDTSGIPDTTTTRQRQAQNMGVFSALVRRASIAAEAVQVSKATFTSVDDALLQVSGLSDKIETEIHLPEAQSDSAIYRALTNLRAAALEDANSRSGGLPRVKKISYPMVTSSLVAAYELYEDSDRHKEITEWNNINHPSFMPPNTTLEVLSK